MMAKETLDGLLKRLAKKAKTPEEVVDNMMKLFENAKHWTKGEETDEHYDEKKKRKVITKVCLIGGTSRLNGPAQEEAEQAIVAAIVRLFPNRINYVEFNDEPGLHLQDTIEDRSNIPEFNDDPDTTIGDVRRVLKEARKILGETRAYREWLKKQPKFKPEAVALNKFI